MGGRGMGIHTLPVSMVSRKFIVTKSFKLVQKVGAAHIG